MLFRNTASYLRMLGYLKLFKSLLKIGWYAWVASAILWIAKLACATVSW